jgi:hypothetical protein
MLVGGNVTRRRDVSDVSICPYGFSPTAIVEQVINLIGFGEGIVVVFGFIEVLESNRFSSGAS